MWLLFPCNFSQTFPTTKCNTTVTARSTQRRLAELPQLFQLTQHRRHVVHRDERHAVLGAPASLVGVQGSAPQRLGLGEGATPLQHVREPQPWIASGAEKFSTAFVGRENTFLTVWFRGIFLDPNLW